MNLRVNITLKACDLFLFFIYQKSYMTRLQEVRDTLEISPFFKTHEVKTPLPAGLCNSAAHVWVLKKLVYLEHNILSRIVYMFANAQLLLAVNYEILAKLN